METIHLVVYIGLAIFTIGGGGGIIAFFQMQTRQNMKIEHLEEKLLELIKEIKETKKDQEKTEKAIVEINTSLKFISESIQDLKKGVNK